MVLKDITFPTPEQNILYDDILLSLAENGQISEVLRFWESRSIFIVLGKIRKPQQDLKTENVLRDKVPVLRRSSGGGTVLVGKGCLNYSLILSKSKHPSIPKIHASYRYILEKIINSLQSQGIDCCFKPVSDIAIVDSKRKFSGNAQKRARRFILHHGTLLYDFDFSFMEKYLRVPADTPQYRAGRSHRDFLTNISLSPEKIKQAFQVAFEVSGKEKLSDKENECLDCFLRAQALLRTLNVKIDNMAVQFV